MTLTAYDTGARCEPKLWQPDTASVRAAMRHSVEVEHIGKVDFDDDEGHTVVTVHVSRDEAGTFVVHVLPFVDTADLDVELQLDPIV